MDNLLPLAVAAQRLGCSTSYLRRRCADGTLPAVRLGTDYRVQWADVLGVLQHRPSQAAPNPANVWTTDDVLSLVDAWVVYLRAVRGLSPNTVDLYMVLLRAYLKRMASAGEPALGVASLFDRKVLTAVFARLPARSFSTRQNTYIMLRSFGAYLVAEAKLAQGTLDGIRSLKPRRTVEPRQTCLKATDVGRLFDCILTRPLLPSENAVFAALVGCMVYAGLRVSEACALRPQDVDLGARTLYVRHGKGGRDRRVGMNAALHAYLWQARALHQGGETFFARPDGTRWDKNKVAKRMKAIALRLGVDITAHGLRRTFATTAASTGKGANAIRIALGHTNLLTTQRYLKTAEAEVVEGMKGW